MLTRRQVLITVTSAATAAVVRGEAKAAAAVPQPATPVRFTVPAGACDTHTHVFGDQARKSLDRSGVLHRDESDRIPGALNFELRCSPHFFE